MAKQLTLEESINLVLDQIMTEVKNELETFDNIIDWLFENACNTPLRDLSSENWDQLEKYTSAKWGKLFKERFGFTDQQYIDQQQRMFTASLLPSERELLDTVKEVTGYTVRFTSEGKVSATYYRSTKAKLVVVPNSYSNGCVFRELALAELGLTVADAEAFFDKIGMTRTKRPVHKRTHTYSLYD